MKSVYLDRNSICSALRILHPCFLCTSWNVLISIKLFPMTSVGASSFARTTQSRPHATRSTTCICSKSRSRGENKPLHTFKVVLPWRNVALYLPRQNLPAKPLSSPSVSHLPVYSSWFDWSLVSARFLSTRHKFSVDAYFYFFDSRICICCLMAHLLSGWLRPPVLPPSLLAPALLPLITLTQSAAPRAAPPGVCVWLCGGFL